MKLNSTDLTKASCLKSLEANNDDMKLINKYTLSPLTADDVFTFKTVMGTNEFNDRNYEPFTKSALEDLKNLYPGKPMIFNHDIYSKQVARVYDTELVVDAGKQTEGGEPYTELIAKAYMAKTSDNESLITDIKAGIVKEVSTGFRVSKLVCNICGKDNIKSSCPHLPGVKYAVNGSSEKKPCHLVIENCSDAYELSFVNVPAQPNAGTRKAYEEKQMKETNEKERLQLYVDCMKYKEEIK